MKIFLDCECYHNYFSVGLLREDGKQVVLERYNDKLYPENAIKMLTQALKKYTVVSFNGNGYDIPLISLFLSGSNNNVMKRFSDDIIVGNKPSWQVQKEWGISPLNIDHIDIIEVAQGKASLKIYGGRIGAEKLQDLPIDPSATIGDEERASLVSYLGNDLRLTQKLFTVLEKPIALREEMSKQYGLDLRSKSDAQIAETIIKSELKKKTGKNYYKPDNVPETFIYQDPKIIEFESPVLKEIFKRILDTDFTLGGNGSVKMPDFLKKPIELNGIKYQMGIGGLHSCEKSQFIEAGEHILCDLDVASYYPNIILQQRLAPKSLGDPFLFVYQSLVNRRIQAKRKAVDLSKKLVELEKQGSANEIVELKDELAYQKNQSDNIKIAINGSFGKLGSKWSALYAPELLIQTTITGQLALLMLIERMNKANIRVVSANTDGIVCYTPKSLEKEMMRVAFNWELDTSYTLERTDYKTVASRDVNNYVAVKLDGGAKGKGCYATPSLSKNPQHAIVYHAVKVFLSNDTPIEETIRGCDDILQFVVLRRVTGGAVFDGVEIGKAIRFYYSTQVSNDDCITYKKNGNKVPMSNGSKPIMDLPDTFPEDINYERYIELAYENLKLVGYKC